MFKKLPGIITFTILLFVCAQPIAAAPTVDSYRTSYQDMSNYFYNYRDIQLFSGGTVLSEFDSNNVYAGHLGSFWAPPFYSAHTKFTYDGPADWQKGFNSGLVFYNYNYAAGAAEQPSDPATEAFWYPSKLVVNKFYPGAGGGTDIRTAKVALPGTRGFGMKVTLTNKSPNPQPISTLFLLSLPTFETRRDDFWNWQYQPSGRSQTDSYLDGDMVIVQDPSTNSYMAIGLSENIDSWGLDENFDGNGYNYPLYDQFLHSGGGHLANSDSDNSGNGTTIGIVSQHPNLAQNQSHTFTMVVGIGSSVEEAKSIVANYRSRDIEQEADNYWNSRLNSLFSSLPNFTSGDDVLNKIYQNSGMTYLVNKWPLFNNFQSDVSGYSQAVTFYPWKEGTAGYFPLADPGAWREQIKRTLAMDFSNCRAFNLVVDANLCDHGYAYNKVSFVDIVYRYVTTTSDFGFLNENINGTTVLQRISNLANDDDALEYPGTHLANYGEDNKLYEYDIHCDFPQNQVLKGKYTGLVVSPNAERIVAHQQVAELAAKVGNTGMVSQHEGKATEIKDSLQTLWNPSAGWFDTLSLYNEAQQRRPEPFRTTFWGMYPLLLLQYNNLLTPEQRQGIVGNIGQFRGDYGFTSVSTALRSNWCGRSDWHGPGLYSGAVGVVLTGLFKNGQENIAYDMLSPTDGRGYAYAARLPYYPQAFQSDTQKIGLLPANEEGLSLGQSFIEGMFGFSPNTRQTKFAPHIPSRLLEKGPVKLENIRAQSHIWDITVTSANNHTINMAVSGAEGGANIDHFRFGYEMNGNLSANISRLQANKSYRIQTIPVNGGDIQTTYATTNDQGVLALNLPLNGDYIINGELGSAPVTVVSVTVNGQPLDLSGSFASLHLPNVGDSDIPVVINYSDGTQVTRIIKFRYQPVGNWSEWGACSASCGGGTQTRTCNGVEGAICEGGVPAGQTQSQSCNIQMCEETPLPTPTVIPESPSPSPVVESPLPESPSPSPGGGTELSPSPSPVESASPVSPSPSAAPRKTGDVNNDGEVDAVDLGMIIQSYYGNPPRFPEADLDGDGSVDAIDLNLVIQNYYK